MGSLLFSLLLAALGAICARPLLEEKAPALRPSFVWLSRNQHYIGIGGLILALIAFISLISFHFMLPVVPLLITFISIVLMLLDAIIVSLDFVRSTFTNPQNGLLVALDRVRLASLPYKQTLGLTSIVFAVLHLGV